MLKYGQNNVHIVIERPLNFQKSNGSHGGPYFSSLRVGRYVGNVKMHYSYPFQLCKKVSEINQRPGFCVLNFLSNYFSADAQKKLSNFSKNQLGRVLYMSSSFGLLRVESRDFSQAEKDSSANKDEQTHKRTTIFTQSSPRLSF